MNTFQQVRNGLIVNGVVSGELFSGDGAGFTGLVQGQNEGSGKPIFEFTPPNIYSFKTLRGVGRTDLITGDGPLSGEINISGRDLSGLNMGTSGLSVFSGVHNDQMRFRKVVVDSKTLSASLSNSGIKIFDPHFAVTGSGAQNTLDSFSATGRNAVIYDVTLRSGESNLRFSEFRAAWTSTTGQVVFNEVSTSEIGDTSAVTLSGNLTDGTFTFYASLSDLGTWNFNGVKRYV